MACLEIVNVGCKPLVSELERKLLHRDHHSAEAPGRPTGKHNLDRLKDFATAESGPRRTAQQQRFVNVVVQHCTKAFQVKAGKTEAQRLRQ